MLSGISFICFAASYSIGLLLELGRMFYFQLGRKPWLIFAVAVAGFTAHSAYILARVQEGLAHHGVPLSNWYHWCIVAAWMLALIYVLLVTVRPNNTFGVFLLPLILLLLGVAQTFPKDQVFSSREATRAWGSMHGIGLLVGTVSIFVGFAAGVMYLLQSYRLKHKISPRWGRRLPSLEWLRAANERCLIWSAFTLAMGILAGVVMNLSEPAGDHRPISWTDPIVLISALMLAWLIASVAFIAIYKPAREGRKVAYLTVTSFLVLAVTLSFVLVGSDHGAATIPPTIQEQQP